MRVQPSRRDSLLWAVRAAIVAGAASATFPGSVLAQSAVKLTDFMALSETLTGATGLDDDAGKLLLAGFIAAGSSDALEGLIAGKSGTAETELRKSVIGAWYSGLYESDGETKVATFTEALVWNALPFTKPFAECGGVVGYWGDAPEKN